MNPSQHIQPVATDKQGHLKNLSEWSPDIAQQLAEGEQIELTEEHWEIIHIIRDYYQQFKISPTMRVLVKAVREKLGPQKGRSIHLMLLFPNSPARQISKIAGLPKPTNCD
ncbi:MAG: TusE/DsrC/DsvC family sulfur relay protein [Pseudomonadales bacterium]|jgi:tRNA 2-thiouridine synthesizing protein E|nr:TusE/DsrC/DsvC family sulfur relay protein [Pseudomonadales bacterium]MDP7358307.1 TusE/DsrC/DsvC family sulfur relay protein [Pseudomonadales bacterium]MDP7597788.1 TusE/DsrC/DsvC family sulfur relay protein [Pseudomonadales bacterium]HJN52325.1 TusE/DsrC/DsvC family sulfur relay protein [Pseudomonadales bacterium]|tara:strand:- start:92 stop:424 length:333 start_codon:yes stop_codon:yes gene_type:complete